MEQKRVRVAAAIVAAVIAGGAAMYLLNKPKVGDACTAGEGVKATADGTPVMCVKGTWFDSVAEDWHMHGPLKMSALIERLLPKDWKVDWRAAENPVVDTEAVWRSGFLKHVPRDGDRVTGALLDAAQYGVVPRLVACWNKQKRTVVVDHSDATTSFKDCEQ